MIFTFFLLAPIVIALLAYCRYVEYMHFKQQKNNVPTADEVYQEYKVINSRRGVKKPEKHLTKKYKSELEMYLEKHGKQLALYMSEKEAFLIPIQSCEKIAAELESWFNNHNLVEYAILETDGIHVKMSTHT